MLWRFQCLKALVEGIENRSLENMTNRNAEEKKKGVVRGTP